MEIEEVAAYYESTNKLAVEESIQHFKYVDFASVTEETDDSCAGEPAATLSGQVIKEELEGEISVPESEVGLWGSETNRLCDGEAVKQDGVQGDESASDRRTRAYNYAGLHGVLHGGDNMDIGIQFSDSNHQIIHLSDKSCMETDKSNEAWLHKKQGSQDKRHGWYRQLAIEEKARMLQKKRDAARKRYTQMTGEEKVRFLQKKRDAIRNRYSQMTDEEKQRILQKLRDARNDRYRQMSGEQKARFLQKKRDAARKRYTQMTDEEKVRFLQKKRDAIRNRYRETVDEEKVHILESKRAAARKRYRKMADEEKERFLQRKRSDVRNRYWQKQARRK